MNCSLCGIDWVADVGPAKIQDLVGRLYFFGELYRLIRVSASATIPSLFQSNNLGMLASSANVCTLPGLVVDRARLNSFLSALRPTKARRAWRKSISCETTYCFDYCFDILIANQPGKIYRQGPRSDCFMNSGQQKKTPYWILSLFSLLRSLTAPAMTASDISLCTSLLTKKPLSLNVVAI